MSTSIEAAAAATIIQLVSNGYGVDVRWRFSAAKWEAAIIDEHGTAWKGRSTQVLAAFVEASCNAEENVGAVLATLHAVELTNELGDAWRLLAAIASEFDFVAIVPDYSADPAKHLRPTVMLKANAHELGTVHVLYTLPESIDELVSGRGLLDALQQLEKICQSSQQTNEPAPALRGNDIAPTSGTIEA